MADHAESAPTVPMSSTAHASGELPASGELNELRERIARIVGRYFLPLLLLTLLSAVLLIAVCLYKPIVFEASVPVRVEQLPSSLPAVKTNTAQVDGPIRPMGLTPFSSQ